MLTISFGFLTLLFVALIIFAIFIFKNKSDDKIKLLIEEFKKEQSQNAQNLNVLKSDLNEKVSSLHSQVIDILQKNNMDVAQRFEASNKVFGDLKSSITKIDESSRQILDLGANISELQNILRAPKLRGNLGEIFLKDLLGQIFPASAFQMQYTFKKNSKTVDAIVKLKDGIIPIDAKFPLEDFNKMLTAQTEKDSLVHRKAFIKMIKKHISDISEKYIIPQEGTFDFALMYIPAENVYYEGIIRDEQFGESNSLLSYSISKKVIPVSPNTFFAYLQTILFGLKGLKIEKEAKTIMKNLAKVENDVDKFSNTFVQLGKNIERVHNSFTSSNERWHFLNSRIQNALGVEESDSLTSKDTESNLLS